MILHRTGAGGLHDSDTAGGGARLTVTWRQSRWYAAVHERPQGRLRLRPPSMLSVAFLFLARAFPFRHPVAPFYCEQQGRPLCTSPVVATTHRSQCIFLPATRAQGRNGPSSRETSPQGA